MNPLCATTQIAVDRLIQERQPKLTFDIGACMGDWTYRLHSHDVTKNIRARLFEPIPNLYESLRQRHLYDPRVVVYNLAIGGHDGVLEGVRPYNCWTLLTEEQAKEKGAELSVLYKLAPPFNIRITTLDRFYNDLNLKPDFVKIDVDGCEVKVLRGARNALSHLPPLYFELWSGAEKYFGDSLEEMCRLIYEIGYDVWALDGSFCAKSPEELLSLVPRDTSFDVLLLKRGDRP